MVGRWVTVNNLSSPKQDQNYACHAYFLETANRAELAVLILPTFSHLRKQYFRRKHTIDHPFHSPRNLADIKWRTSVETQEQKFKIICLG